MRPIWLRSIACEGHGFARLAEGRYSSIETGIVDQDVRKAQGTWKGCFEQSNHTFYTLFNEKQTSIMSKQTFKWDDPFLFNDQLTDEERMIRDTAQATG
jgi:hypothetical protein